MRGAIFHILICFLLVAVSATANAESWCQPKVTPTINVKTDTNRIKWVFNKSQKDLNQKDIDTVNPYGNSVITDVGGLMHGGIKMQQRMEFGTLTNPNVNETCMFYNSVDASFHIYPTIYIAREYPQGSCMHNAIRAHELQHVNIDRQIVNKYALLVGNAIKSEINRQFTYGPVPSSNRNAIQAQMRQRMEGILRQHSTAMDAERRKLQQDLDSLSEYERVNHLCDGNVKRY
ncbi:MAG: hypothetical protein DI586_09405 [Micavibrio aeruginosavorus]|uniref:DUF922 domain-containing protein n=1 Tax=Micavibrio aeruginosavorus TaxID=349221 RepID=A0A2W5H951_9BACT|nr:MAG: hypothetical protein DI586_09405 [Micavibrio aeruginosavorus]